MHLLHLSFYGGKRGCLAAFLSDFSSSDGSVLLQLGAKTTELSLDGDISLDKVTVVLGMFVSTDVLFEPVLVSVWKTTSPISGNWFRTLTISCKRS